MTENNNQDKAINDAWTDLTEALDKTECHRIEHAQHAVEILDDLDLAYSFILQQETRLKLARTQLQNAGHAERLISDAQTDILNKTASLDCDVNDIKMELGNITDELDLTHDLIEKTTELINQAQSSLDNESLPELSSAIEHLEAITRRSNQAEYHADQVTTSVDSIDNTLTALKDLI